MLVEDIINESYYDFVKDDSIDDMLNHSKRMSKQIYLKYKIDNNEDYDMIILAVAVPSGNVENYIITVNFMKNKSLVDTEYLSKEQAQKLIDKFSKLDNVEKVSEDLRKWFKQKWVRFGPDGKIRGDCARGDDSEGKPKCLPQSKAHALGKKGRAQAAGRKRRQDPDADRRGPGTAAPRREPAEPLRAGLPR
jgi:phage anti-repressor protein